MATNIVQFRGNGFIDSDILVFAFVNFMLKSLKKEEDKPSWLMDLCKHWDKGLNALPIEVLDLGLDEYVTEPGRIGKVCALVECTMKYLEPENVRQLDKHELNALLVDSEGPTYSDENFPADKLRLTGQTLLRLLRGEVDDPNPMGSPRMRRSVFRLPSGSPSDPETG